MGAGAGVRCEARGEAVKPEPEQPMRDNRPPEQLPMTQEFTTLTPVTPLAQALAILDRAVEKGIAVEAIERLMDLVERTRASQARAAFHEAMARFKETCPPVPRRTENSQFKVTKNGTQKPRNYASLEDIAATINKPAAECGLSYRWGSAKIDAGQLTISCIVSHLSGHSESSEATLPVESRAGCSDQQKMGTAMTYAQRYSLISAFGLTSCDEDDDGEDIAVPKETITESQAADLASMIQETKSDLKKFLDLYGVQKIADLPAVNYGAAVRLLEGKRR